MVWWLALPPKSPPPRGVIRLKPWLGAAEALRLAEAVAALYPSPTPVLPLPIELYLSLDAAQQKVVAAVLVAEAPQDAETKLQAPGRGALILWGPGGEATPTRALRESLSHALSMSLSQEGHPLRLLGAGPWLAEALTRRAAEPEELLDLLDRAVAHRRALPDRDEPAWTRSVEHAAGAHVAARLLALAPEPRWDTLRLLVGLGEPAEGLLAGERAGLVSLSGGRVTVTAVARGLGEGEARGGLLAGLEGAGLPKDLRRVLVPAPEGLVAMAISPTPSAPSVGVDSLLAEAARAWIGGLEGPDGDERALLERGLAAIEAAERWASINEQGRLSGLGPTALALREAGQRAGGAVGARAAALAELIVLAAAWLPEDDERGARALATLRQMYFQGVFTEALLANALLRRATVLLNPPKARDTRADVAALLDELAGLDGGPQLRAEHLALRGQLLWAEGRGEEAVAQLTEAYEAFGALGLARDQAVMMGQIADVFQARGQLDEANRIRREEELPVYERLGDERNKAITLGKIADMFQARGQLHEALRIRREEELPVYERLGDERNKAITLDKIADVLEKRGQLDEALRIRREEVLPVFERLGDEHSKAATMSKIADVLQARGQLDEALRIRREEVLPVFERLGDVRSRAVTMGKIADVLQVRGQLDEALRIRREEQLPVFERLGDVHAKAVTMSRIADALQVYGQLDEALRIRREEQLPVFEQLGDVREKAVTMGRIADVLRARGQFDEALRIYREEALPVFERLGDVNAKANTMSRIGDVFRARGQLDEALRIYREEALPIFDQLGDVRAKASTMSRIADVLLARGRLDEALRIYQEEVLPVYERLGDVYEKAITMSRIARILASSGRGAEALRLMQEEVLPVIERLQRPLDLLIEQGNIAALLLLSRDRKRRDEARALLTTALHSAVEMNLPAEVAHLRSLFAKFNMKAPSTR